MKTIKIECTEKFLEMLFRRIIDLENRDALRVPSANEFMDLEKRVEKLETLSTLQTQVHFRTYTELRDGIERLENGAKEET